MNQRPCDICLHEYEEHIKYHQENHLFCPDNDFENYPPEIFDCYIPCSNLRYLEYKAQKRELI